MYFANFGLSSALNSFGARATVSPNTVLTMANLMDEVHTCFRAPYCCNDVDTLQGGISGAQVITSHHVKRLQIRQKLESRISDCRLITRFHVQARQTRQMSKSSIRNSQFRALRYVQVLQSRQMLKTQISNFD